MAERHIEKLPHCNECDRNFTDQASAQEHGDRRKHEITMRYNWRAVQDTGQLSRMRMFYRPM